MSGRFFFGIVSDLVGRKISFIFVFAIEVIVLVCWNIYILDSLGYCTFNYSRSEL